MPENIQLDVDVSEYVALCNTIIPQPEQQNYEVTRDAIRHIAYAIDDYNALYLNEEFARTTRWGGIIAPPGYLYNHGTQFLCWPNMLGRIVDSDGNVFDMNDNMGDDWEFLLPVRPGDVINSTCAPSDIIVKRGQRMGVFAIAFAEARFVNQRGELVARLRTSMARWSGEQQRKRGQLGAAYPALDPERARIARSGKRVPNYARNADPMPRRYERHNMSFDDVMEGQEVMELAIGPLTTGHLRIWESHMWGNARAETGGQSSRADSSRNLYAAGVLRVPWFGTMLTRWAGPNVWIHKLTFRNKEWVFVGYTYFCRGRVTRKFVEDGRRYVECEVRVENELGIVTNTGVALLELHSGATARA